MKDKATPIEIDDETPVVFIFRNGHRITVSLSVYVGGLKIESDRRMTVLPSSTKIVFIE